MKFEQEIKDKCNELFQQRNDLPRFGRTPEQEQRFHELYLQAVALQWALGVNEEWYG